MQNFIIFKGDPNDLVAKLEDLRDNDSATGISVTRTFGNGSYLIIYDTP